MSDPGNPSEPGPDDDWDDDDVTPLLTGRLPSAFAREVQVLDAGSSLRYDDARWRDRLVVVRRGRMVLVGRCGLQVSCGPGEVLWLAGLNLVRLANPGPGPAELVALRRRDQPLTPATATVLFHLLGLRPQQPGRGSCPCP